MCVPSQKIAVEETTVRYAVSIIFKSLMQNSMFILGKKVFFQKQFTPIFLSRVPFCIIYFGTP